MSENNDPTPEKPDEIDHDITDQPVCPYCGHVEKDEGDLLSNGFAYDGDVTTVECDACHRLYEIMLFVAYEFSTRAVPVKEPR